MTSKLRAIIFDLDGTLIDSAKTIAGILHSMQDARGLEKVDVATVKTWVSHGADTFIPMALGYSFDDEDRRIADVAEFRSIYKATPPDPSELFPDAIATLTELQRQGYKIAICTNKPEPTARLIIDGIGLAPYVNALVGKREGQPEKPDPAPLWQALSELEQPADGVAYVGDSEVDAQAAQAADFPFFLVTFGYPVGVLDEIPRLETVDALSKLPDLLASIERTKDVPR